MMFKFSDPISNVSTPSELADYIEWQAWQNGQVSTQEVISALGKNNENLLRGGPGDEDDANETRMAEVMKVAIDRKNACNGAYPFLVEERGQLLRYVSPQSNLRAEVYLYLLLCTRLDMQQHRRQAGKDGTALFEELTAHILHSYLGYERARYHVFGTAVSGAFHEKVDRLCAELGEGGKFRKVANAPAGGDGKLDVVAWVPFHDQRPGKLILFAQSKTGTSWRGTTTQLRPDTFISKWMELNILPEPVRVFCVSEVVDRKWQDVQPDAGILFDRCRIVDFADRVPSETMEEIRAWTKAGYESLRLAPYIDTS